LASYGVKADQLKAPVGEAVTPASVEQALKSKKYKIVTATHVDTSTGMCRVYISL
jgi:alanine-glyoxylate transaminase/serine-glyoxylate transaminase/serine-pyruvate transaminase